MVAGLRVLDLPAEAAKNGAIMALVEKNFRPLYGVLFAVFILFGMSMTIIGATLPKILADFNWSYTIAGAVIGAGAVGYFLATYAAGFLVSAIGPRLTVSLGLILDVVGLLLFAAVPSPIVNFILYFCIGIGQGFIELTINWATLRMEKSGTGRAMNLMHGAFAAGAFLGPFVIGFLMTAELPWTLIYRGIALLLFLVFLVLQPLPMNVLGRGDHQRGVSRRELFSHPAYWLGFASLLMYVGVELGVSNWVAEYFVSAFGSGPAIGSFMVSLFWGGLLLGRFGVPVVYHGNRRELVLLSMAALMSVSIIALSLVGFIGSGTAVVVGSAFMVVFAGLGCSIVYPIVVTIVGDAFPASQSEAVAFSSMGGGIGAFVFPFIMSNIASAWGIRAGFATYAFFSVLVVMFCLALVRVTKGRSTRPSA
jgi:fucose permease